MCNYKLIFKSYIIQLNVQYVLYWVILIKLYIVIVVDLLRQHFTRRPSLDTFYFDNAARNIWHYCYHVAIPNLKDTKHFDEFNGSFSNVVRISLSRNISYQKLGTYFMYSIICVRQRSGHQSSQICVLHETMLHDCFQFCNQRSRHLTRT